MGNPGFTKLEDPGKRFYGTPALLLCGFDPEVQPKFLPVLEFVGLSAVPKVWATSAHSDTRLSDLLSLPDGSGWGEPSGLPRAVIVAGIREKELTDLMAVCRDSRMIPALWAVLTPTSETWTLGSLLAELSAERAALEKRGSGPTPRKGQPDAFHE